ncbi:MAG: methyltransferase family protein [Promethearchaeota archaeon]
MTILTFIFIITLLISYSMDIVVLTSIKDKSEKYKAIYYKSFTLIWFLSLFLIPFLNSSLFFFIFPENMSYLGRYWIWFLPLGIIFIILGIKIYSMARKLYKNRTNNELKFVIIREGIFKIMRNPSYTSWILIYVGVVLILDSFIGLIFCPIFYILIEIKILIEEKVILFPRLGDQFKAYKDKTPYRLFPNPYNYILIIVGVLIIYIGFLSLLS